MACRTAHECTNLRSPGNCGSFVNSTHDDVAPRFFDGVMYFTTHRTLTDLQSTAVPPSIKDYLFECSRLDDGNFSAAKRTYVLPAEAWGGAGPTIHRDSDSSMVAVFSITRGEGKDLLTDLGISIMRNGVWSEPQILSSCSSAWWEAQPFFSKDGTMLAFTSDRPGGMGGLDIWISSREGDTWSEPRNAGSVVNSSANEITPSFDDNGNVLFSTDLWSQAGYEIMRTTPGNNSPWGNLERLPPPINSSFDDISGVVWGDSIFYASNRPGGCGGYDIYGMILCGPVVFRGEVQASASIVRRSGIVTILDSSGRLQQTLVRDDGSFEVRVLPRKSYIVRYVNECSNDAIEQRFTAPCNETTAVVFRSTMILPEAPAPTLITLNKPFFIPGYYRPLTTSALTSLRIQSEMNLQSSDALPLRYRSIPSTADDDAQCIDTAITTMCAVIIQEMNRHVIGCGLTSQLYVDIKGFPDDVSRTETESFDESSIVDSSTSVNVTRGSSLDDTTLALLRAQYMKRVLETRISSILPPNLHMTDIHWTVHPGKRGEWNPVTQQRKIEITLR